MPRAIAIVIVRPEHLTSVKKRLAESDVVSVVSEADLVQVQDALLSQPPDVVVMHSAFAATSRGATLVAGLKAKAVDSSTAVRVFIEDDVKSPLILSEDSLSPLDALLETTRSLERAGTRQAARYPMNRLSLSVNSECWQADRSLDLGRAGAVADAAASA